MTRVTGSHINPFGGNDSYMYVDYTVVSQNYASNTTTISWTLGWHLGSANVRLDNSNCHFTNGTITGDPNGGPFNSGYPLAIGGGTNLDWSYDSGTFTVTHDALGHRTLTLTGSTSTDYGTSSISTGIALPNIPQTPVAPDGTAASRASDTSASLTWTNHSDSDHPYDHIAIYRQVDGGGFSVLNGNIGVVSSYSDTSISANHKYRFGVHAIGSNGVEVAGPDTNDIWTTPGAPTGCTATRLSNGNIQVSWADHVNYSEYTTRIEHSTDGGSTWAEITFISDGSTSYVHTGPPSSAQSHRYRVRARSNTGSLNSAYSTSSTVAAAPAAPTSVTATYVSDTQITVGWTNNTSGDAPYTSIKVLRSTDGGGYALIGTIGVVTSFTDNSAAVNHKYTYIIEAINSTGFTDSIASSPVWTTPGAPTALTAAKTVSNDVQLTWTNHVNYSEFQTEIYESTDGGSVYNLLTTVGSGIATYTHVAPSTATTHTYRVRAKTSSGAVRNSAYATSGTVTLLSTAAAPTGLAPAGITLDGNEVIVFTWVHNPTDGTPQSAYQLEWSDNGGSSWTVVGPTTSSVSSYSMPASTIANAKTITWRMKTAGQNGTLSAYSANSTFTTQNRPTATTGALGGTVNQSHPTFTWTYFQAQGSAQAAWHAFLWRDNGDTTFTVLEEKAGTGATASVLFDTALLNGGNYRIGVYVTSASGLVSLDTTSGFQTFTVVFLPPAATTVVPVYDALSGTMVVTVTGAAPVVGVTEAIDHVDLQRQVNGGSWVTFAPGVILSSVGGVLTAVVIDTAPVTFGHNTYRALAVSALPSSALSAPVEADTQESQWCFLSSGDGFSQIMRMRALVSIPVSVGRNKTTQHFAGRKKPVELSGEAVDFKLNVSASLYGLSSRPDELEEMAVTETIILWRDFEGHRIYGSISNVQINYETQANITPVTFQLIEVDYVE